MKIIIEFLNDNQWVAHLIALVGFCIGYMIIKTRNERDPNSVLMKQAYNTNWEIKYGLGDKRHGVNR